MAARTNEHRYKVYIKSAKGEYMGYLFSTRNSTRARELAIAKYPDVNPMDIFVQYAPPSHGSIKNKKTNDKYKEQGALWVPFLVHEDDMQIMRDMQNNLLIARGIKE